MIRMSKETDYGIVLLTHLAGEGVGLSLSARELAQETHIPLPMVSKILKALAREGLLLSQRGAKGGYSLAREPAQITVADVIRVLEGPIAMTECLGQPGDCQQEPICRVRRNWKTINRTVETALDGITLRDMLDPLPPLVPLVSGADGASAA